MLYWKGNELIWLDLQSWISLHVKQHLLKFLPHSFVSEMHNSISSSVWVFLHSLLSSPASAAPAPEPTVITRYLYVQTLIYPAHVPIGWTSTFSESTRLLTYTITPTVTPSLVWTTRTDTSNPSTTLVEVLLASDATRTIPGDNETHYAVPITFHPLPECQTSYNHTWTTSTNVQFMLPITMDAGSRSSIMNLTPSTITPSLTSWSDWVDTMTKHTTYTKTIQIAILNPTDLDPALVASVSETDFPPPMTACQIPTSHCYLGETKTLATTTLVEPESCTLWWKTDPRWYENHPGPGSDSGNSIIGLFIILAT